MANSTGSHGAGGALLSCLGFPGWGTLHLIVPTRGDPSGLAGRLPLAGAAEDGPAERPAGVWLAALLSTQGDLEPLAPCQWPWSRRGPGSQTGVWPSGWGHRYLLVCRWGDARPLRLSAWEWQEGTWRRLCSPVSPAGFRQRFLGPRPTWAGSGERRAPEGLRR